MRGSAIEEESGVVIAETRMCLFGHCFAGVSLSSCLAMMACVFSLVDVFEVSVVVLLLAVRGSIILVFASSVRVGFLQFWSGTASAQAPQLRCIFSQNMRRRDLRMTPPTWFP